MTFPVGKSFLTYVNGGWGGGVTGLSSLDGTDASENETNRFVKYQNDRWYKFRVRVTSDTVRCAVDDVEIIALNYKDRQVGTRIESRACQPLGFATWETTGAVRNVTIRMLSPAEVTRTPNPNSDSGLGNPLHQRREISPSSAWNAAPAALRLFDSRIVEIETRHGIHRHIIL